MEYKINDYYFTYFNNYKGSRIEVRLLGRGYVGRIDATNDMSFTNFKSECEQWFNSKGMF